jgi:hypothetical protein
MGATYRLVLFILSAALVSSCCQSAGTSHAVKTRTGEALAKRQATLAKSMGMCQVKVPTVKLEFWDHGHEDGDRVKLKWNDKILKADMTVYTRLKKQGTFTVNADVGANSLIITALNAGAAPPNTARVLISPCRDGKPLEFIWNMKTGETRHLSITRK